MSLQTWEEHAPNQERFLRYLDSMAATKPPKQEDQPRPRRRDGAGKFKRPLETPKPTKPPAA